MGRGPAEGLKGASGEETGGVEKGMPPWKGLLERGDLPSGVAGWFSEEGEPGLNGAAISGLGEEDIVVV